MRSYNAFVAKIVFIRFVDHRRPDADGAASVANDNFSRCRLKGYGANPSIKLRKRGFNRAGNRVPQFLTLPPDDSQLARDFRFDEDPVNRLGISFGLQSGDLFSVGPVPNTRCSVC